MEDDGDERGECLSVPGGINKTAGADSLVLGVSVDGVEVRENLGDKIGLGCFAMAAAVKPNSYELG